MENRTDQKLEIVSKVSTEIAIMSDDEIVAKFVSFIYGSLSTFVDHPIGEEKPSYLTAINYILSLASSKMDIKQQEVFKTKWLKFKEHTSEFARVNETILEQKSLFILASLEKEKDSDAEGIVSRIKRTLSAECGVIWEETQNYEDTLSNRAWERACSISEGRGLSPWLFLD